MPSQATTVAEYLAELSPERRTAVEAVRQVILQQLDTDYEEGMTYGMIGYYVPHRVYPAGYHCNPRQPVPFAGLASQKNYLSLYLMSVYAGEEAWFRQAWAKTGKKLDMGKCCVRFKKVEDLALDVIAQAIRRMPTSKFIALYETVLKKSRQRTTTKTPATSQRVVQQSKPVRKQSSPNKTTAVKKSASRTPQAKSPAKRRPQS